MAKVIMMRHGEAASEDVYDEDGRFNFSMTLDELSKPTGVEQVKSVARQLINAGIRPDAFIHSPKGRTAQTAGIIGNAYAAAGHKIVPAVAAADLEVLRFRIPFVLSKMNGASTVLAISHSDDIQSAVENLTGSPLKIPAPPDEQPPLYMHHAAAVIIETKANRWDEALRDPKNNRVTGYLMPSIGAPPAPA